MENQDKDSRQPFELEETPPPRRLRDRARPSMTLNKRLSMVMLGVLFMAMIFLAFSQWGGNRDKDVTQQEPGRELAGDLPAGPAVQGKVPEPETSVAVPDQEPPLRQGPVKSDAATPPSQEQGVDVLAQAREASRQASQETQPVGRTDADVTSAPQMQPEEEEQPGEQASPPQPQEQAQAVAKPEAKPLPQAVPLEKKPVVQAAPKEHRPETQTPARAKQAQRTTERTTPKALPKGAVNQLHNIKFTVEHSSVVMHVITTGAISKYTSFSLKQPQRMVLDLFGSFKVHAGNMKVPDNNYVGGVRIGNHPDKLRIVADIKEKMPLKMSVERVSEKEITLTITR